MPQPRYNFFAIVDDPTDRIKRIQTVQGLQQELGELFDSQVEAFKADKEEVEFTDGYSPGQGEIFFIENFELSDDITQALENPLNVSILNLPVDSEEKIRGIFGGIWTQGNKLAFFQIFDSRRVLAKKWAILFSGQTFSKLDRGGLILDQKLVALVEDSKLYFESFFFARRILKLDQYFTEATDSEIDSFISSNIFEVGDADKIKKAADGFIRKKVAILIKNNTLNNLTAAQIQASAQRFGVTVQVSNNKISFPETRRPIKELLRVVDEDYFTTSITQRRCLTNSKKVLR
jgi:hypothetical protein